MTSSDVQEYQKPSRRQRIIQIVVFLLAIITESLCIFVLFYVPSGGLFQMTLLYLLLCGFLAVVELRMWYNRARRRRKSAKNKGKQVNEADQDEETFLVNNNRGLPDRGLRKRVPHVLSDEIVLPQSPSIGQSDTSFSSFFMLLQQPQHTTRRRIYTLHFLAILILFTVTLDYVFHDYLFVDTTGVIVSRLGAVTHNDARLMVRYAGEKPDENVVQIWFKETSTHRDNEWQLGPMIKLLSTNDYTGSFRLDNLRPSTSYIVIFVLHPLNQTFSARSSPPINPSSPIPPATFRTSPSPNSTTVFTFATGSCVKPNYPYFTSLYNSSGIPGFRKLASLNPDFMVFLGDFIYADSPFYFGQSVEDYRRLYRFVMGFNETKEVMSIPGYFTYDDHEVHNNWDKGVTPLYEQALQAFNEYVGFTNPTPLEPSHSYYNFTYADSSFFVTDSRRYRSRGWAEDNANKTMLGERQKEALKKWLLDTNHMRGFKFIITSVPMTVNWNIDKDTWASYLTERNDILNYIYINKVRNVIVLSGDRHAIGHQLLPHNITEFSTSPINQFSAPINFYFPHANEPVLFVDRSSSVNIGLLTVDSTREKPIATYKLVQMDGVKWEYTVQGS